MSNSASSPFVFAEQIQAVGDQLQSLQRRVELLEAKTATHLPPTSTKSSFEELAAMGARFAQDIFHCPVRLEQDHDPESPEYGWYNIWVVTDIAHDELRQLRQQWYDRIASLGMSDSTVLRLLVARSS
jgi:hypothetical protein